MSRLRAGEWTAVAGAVGLVVTLFLPWFELDLPGPAGAVVNEVLAENGGTSGWNTLGWLVIVIALAAVGCAAWLTVATAAGRPVAQQVAAGVLTATAGTLAVIALALRALVFQPGSNDLVGMRYGAWLGLLAVLMLALGGWWAIKDDRTDATESAYAPPEPRPAPPAA